MIAKLDAEPAAPDHEELVFVFMMVPREFALTFTSLTSWPFTAAIVFGRQHSLNSANLSSRLILSISVVSCSPTIHHIVYNRGEESHACFFASSSTAHPGPTRTLSPADPAAKH